MQNAIFIHLLLSYKYAILFPLAFFEGPLIALLAGFFVALGFIDPIVSYLIFVLADVSQNICVYSLGRFSHRHKFFNRVLKKMGVSEEKAEDLQNVWHIHPGKTMFLSKLTYIFSPALLASAGMARMPFKKFIAWAVSATTIYYALFMFIGFHLGNSYQLASKYIKYFELVVIGLVIILVIAYILTAKKAEKKIVSEVEKS